MDSPFLLLFINNLHTNLLLPQSSPILIFHPIFIFFFLFSFLILSHSTKQIAHPTRSFHTPSNSRTCFRHVNLFPERDDGRLLNLHLRHFKSLVFRISCILPPYPHLCFKSASFFSYKRTRHTSFLVKLKSCAINQPPLSLENSVVCHSLNFIFYHFILVKDYIS